MFFLFAIGVRTDTRMMVRPGRQALILGISVMSITLVFSVLLAILLRSYIKMDKTLYTALPFIAAAQCLTAFSNVSCLLVELRMASSDLGRIASSTAILGDSIGMVILSVMYAVLQSNFDPMRSILSVGSSLLFVMAMVYAVRPIVRRIVKRIPVGKPLGDQYVFFCFAGVLMAGFITEVIGQHFMFGPVILGFVVPDGPPLGAPMISKLDLPVGKFLYPTFLTTSGIKTNIFKIDPRSSWIVAFLIASTFLVKVGSAIAASRFVNINFHDALILGLILNARGVCELLMYNLWRDGGVSYITLISLSSLSSSFIILTSFLNTGSNRSGVCSVCNISGWNHSNHNSSHQTSL